MVHDLTESNTERTDINKLEEEDEDNDDADDADVAAFTAVDFTGVNFDETDDADDTHDRRISIVRSLIQWERQTPFRQGFGSFPEELADKGDNDRRSGDDDDEVIDWIRTMSRWHLEGKYKEVLTSPLGAFLFESPLKSASSSSSSVRHCIRQRVWEYCVKDPSASSSWNEAQNEFRCIAMELMGIAALNLYLQNNYTGPSLLEEEQLIDIHPHPGMTTILVPDSCAIESTSNNSDELKTRTTRKANSAIHTAILAELVVDGEWPCPVCYTPYFLLVARSILTTIAEITSNRRDVNFRDWTSGSGCMNGTVATPTATSFETLNGNCNSVIANVIDANEAYLLQGVHVWSARACVAHERLLQARRPTDTLWMEAQQTFQICRSLFCAQGDTKSLRVGSVVNGSDIDDHEVAAMIWLEWGLAEHYFDRPKKGKPSFTLALQSTGLSLEVTGSLGKRTKFQQKSTAQMIVRAKSAATNSRDLSDPALTTNDAESERIKSQMIEHSEDGILLDRIKFEQQEHNELQDLTILDQAILLALCLDVKNSNPSDCLTAEEMSAFLARVLDHHDDWMVYSTALLERAWLEFERSHARERAILQMQALVDQHTNRLTITQSTRDSIENSAPVQERLRYLHLIVYPPRWSVLQDLAERYASMGIVSSAAELFAEVELWDMVVECYRRAGRVSHAEKIVREQLAVMETPRMWAALGDLTKEPEHYEKAISLSKGRYFDAYLALGEYYFGKNEIDKAAGYYEKALAVRPLIPSAWFRLGAINMQLGRWSGALRAFSEVVLQKPEEAEAWANIAAVHMHNKEPSEAYPALNESLRYMRTNWRVWVSKLYTCLDLQKYDEAIQACNMLLDLRAEKRASDGIPPLEEKCVRAIVGGTLQRFHESRNDEIALDSSRRTLTRVHTLLDRISTSSDAGNWIFETISVFHEQAGQDSDKILDALTKEYRALQSNNGWEKDNALLVRVCQVVSYMVHIYKTDKSGGRDGLVKARFVLRGVIQRVQTTRADDTTIPAEVHRLETLLEEIESELAHP